MLLTAVGALVGGPAGWVAPAVADGGQPSAVGQKAGQAAGQQAGQQAVQQAGQQAAGPAASPAADDRPLVLGIGDQISGRIDVLCVGPADAPFGAALERVAADAAARGLELRIERRTALGPPSAANGNGTADIPVVPLLVAAWPCAPEDVERIIAFSRARLGLLVLVGDVDSALGQFPDMREAGLTVAGFRVAEDPRRRSPRPRAESSPTGAEPGAGAAPGPAPGGNTEAAPATAAGPGAASAPADALPPREPVALVADRWPAPTVLLLPPVLRPEEAAAASPAEARRPDELALAVVRHAIAGTGGVRHRVSAFEFIRSREEAGRIVVEAPTDLEGTVSMDVVSLDGRTFVPPQPVGSFDRAAVSDPASAVLRLRFDGSGVSDVRRLRLADTVTTRIGHVELAGPRTVLVGDPMAFRVVLTKADGRPAGVCTVRAEFGGRPGASPATPANTSDSSPPPTPPDPAMATSTATATTDEAGVAVVRFPPRTTPADAPQRLVVTASDGWTSVSARAAIDVVARAASVLIDRALHRPGDLVKGIVFAHGPGGEPSPGKRMTIRIQDARHRLVRAFDVETDDLGAAAFEFPLAREAACGAWTVAAALKERAETRSPGVAPTSAARTAATQTTFTVEDTETEPFEVRIEPDAAASSGGRVRGAVVIRDWDGLPVEDAVVRISVNSAPATEIPGPSPVAFDVAIPDPRGASGAPTISAVVRRRGEIVKATATLPATALRLSVPPEVRAGGRLTVALSGAQGASLADLAVVSGGRLIAAGHVRLSDGNGTAELAIPADERGGPCAVTARLRGRTEAAAADTTVSALVVDVSAPPTVAPGAPGSLGVRVTDATGEAVPAILSVLGAEASWRASAAESGVAGPDDRTHALAGLGASDRDDEAEDGFLAAARRAAQPALDRVAEALARGESLAAHAPWGDRIQAWSEGSLAVAVVEVPATRRHGVDTGTARWRVAADRRAGAGVAQVTAVGAETFLHSLPVPGRIVHVADASDDWLARHQMPNGSWDPRAVGTRCRPRGACAGLAPDGFVVSATSLALLDYLGCGETHQSGNAKHVVRAGLDWLLSRQAADGFVGDRSAPCAVLEHAFATAALTEAFGMTQSRWLAGPARRAALALVALQRPDGGFAETGARRGSVVAGTIAMLAVKSARMADVEIPPATLRDVTDRHLAWMRANADPTLGAPMPSEEETALYPFGRTHPRRLGAASAALLRMFAGESPDESAELRALVETVCSDLPRVGDDEDPFSMWLGTLATFSYGGGKWNRTADKSAWRRWQPALEYVVINTQDVEDVCSRGSWPDRAGPAGRLLSTTFQTLMLEVFYRYGRVFGTNVADEQAPRVRAWFPDTCISELGARTGADGRRDLGFVVPDQITRWRFDVGAWDRAGRFGRSSGESVATLPLVVAAGLPSRLVRGDVVNVPVSVRSTQDEDAECAVTVTRHDGCDIVEAPAASLLVPAGGGASTSVRLRVTGGGAVVLGVSVSGGGASDAVEAAATVGDVVPVPVAAMRVEPGATVRVASVDPDARATLRVFASPLGASRSAVEALIRRPTGCFEQTCATLLPAALAAKWTELPASDPRTALLREGAQRLLSFEAERGGFSLWPGGDYGARADLTALGIHVLLDLADVSPPDPEVLRRAGEFLDRKFPTLGAESVLAVGALRRLGRADLPPLPELGDDSYLLGLALTQDVLGQGVARDAVRRLEASADRSVRGRATWRSASRGLFSGVTVSVAETTAVAVEALARANGDPQLVREGLASVRATMLRDGGWRTTRETVASLRALLATGPIRATGRVTAEIPGRAAVVVPLEADVVDVDLGAWPADAALTFRHEGTGEPWGMLLVRGGSATDSGARPGAIVEPPMALDVVWPKDAVRAGDAVPVRVTVSAESRVESPMVVVPIPGGLSVDVRRLRDAALTAGFEFVEFTGGEVRLYASWFRAGESVRVDIPCTARTAGTFRASSATAWPYYEPDRIAVAAAGAAVVEIPAR